jgi:ferredoxin
VKVTVDPDVCCLYAQCVATAPEVFRIEDDDLAYDREPEEVLRSAVEAAVAACPAQAISLSG